MANDENVSPLEPRLPTDAELEALLDEESDDEFGQPRLDETTKAVLKEWSAQDFANIYTRFRPHLERHARRFLRNQSQVDEVVQDAFLYLMVTLPELDSELGVLRFLKWKVRLLCLDVIRASGRAQLSDIDAHPEFESNGPEVSAALEQAEDAAIVRLALSKLNPRHREVLIASMYEEKTSAQIAAQVGLTENATNQLIFRARAAFKKALLGDDVDTTGMSTAKILSVAARKAALEAKKVGAQAMVFVLFLALAIGAFVNFTGRQSVQNQAGEQTSKPTVSAPSEPSTPIEPAPSVEPAKQTTVAKPESVNAVVQVSNSTPSPSASPFTVAAEEKVMDSRNSEVVFVRKTSIPDERGLNLSGEYVASASQGIYSEFTFNYLNDQKFSNVKVYFLIGDKPYLAATTFTEIVSGVDQFGLEHIVYYGAVDYLVNKKGEAVETSKITKGTMRIELVLNKTKTAVVSTSLDVLEK